MSCHMHNVTYFQDLLQRIRPTEDSSSVQEELEYTVAKPTKTKSGPPNSTVSQPETEVRQGKSRKPSITVSQPKVEVGYNPVSLSTRF